MNQTNCTKKHAALWNITQSGIIESKPIKHLRFTQLIYPVQIISRVLNTNCPMNRSKHRLSSIVLAFIAIALGTTLSAQGPAWNLAGKEGSNQPDGGRNILALPSGEAYLIGRFQPPSISFAGGTTLTTLSGNDSYLLKYNPAGIVEWVIGIRGAALNEEVISMQVDVNGDLVLVGNFQDSVLVDQTKIFASGSLKRSGYVAKVSRFGNVLFAKEVGSTTFSCEIAGMTLDANSNIIIAGSFGGTLTSNGHVANSAGGSDMFFTFMDKNAKASWLKSFGGSENDEVWGMDLADNGEIYATGTISHSVQFGTQLVGQQGLQSFVMLNLKANGAVASVDNQLGIGPEDRLDEVKVTAQGKVYAGGVFQNTITVNGTSYTSAGSRDGLILQYNLANNLQWVRTMGGNSSDEILDLDIDPLGNCYVIGNFNGTANFSGTNINTQSFFGDAFVARYAANGNLDWTTGLGAGMFDIATGYGISLDQKGMGYITGEFASSLTFNGQTINSGGGVDLFWAIFCQSPEIGLGTLSTTTYCEGANLSVPYTAQGCYDGANVFTLELSDASGSFAAPTVLTTNTTVGSGTLSAAVPMGIAPGNGYRVRVSASAPSYQSPDNGVDLTLANNPGPVVQSAGGTQLCTGSTVLLSTTNSFASYLWSDGSTNSTVNASTAGTWTVMVTDANGCVGSDDIVLTSAVSPTPVILPMGTVALCNGNPVTLDPGAGFASYLWSDGSTSQTLTAAVAGSYEVTVTSSAGCEGVSNTVNVVNSSVPTISQNVDTLFSSVANSYQWNLNGVAIPGATGAYYVPTQSGNYTVSVITAFGCNEESAPISVVLTALDGALSSNLKVFPNPANAWVNIEVPSHAGIWQVAVVGINGQTVWSGDLAGTNLQIATQDLPAGFYMLQIKGEEFSRMAKVQIMH